MTALKGLTAENGEMMLGCLVQPLKTELSLVRCRLRGLRRLAMAWASPGLGRCGKDESMYRSGVIGKGTVEVDLSWLR
jgi:hypothetical protein